MVNVARGVKDKAKWEHLLRRCEGASAVLRTRNFNTDIFFRKRVLVGLAPKSKAIQAKPMPRPAEPAKNAGIEKKARPTAVPLLLPTAKIAPKHPPPKAQPHQPQPPKVPGLAVLKLRLPAPLKPGVSKPTPQGGPAPKTPPKNPSKLGPPKTPPKNGGYSGAWTQDKPSTPASRNACQAKPQPSQEEQSGSRWRAKSDDSHRWKSNEGASKRARSNDRSQRDTWKQGRWKQRDKQGQHEQRWQRTTWKV